MAKTKRTKVSGHQKSIDMFDDSFGYIKEENRHISHENHIEDSKLIKENTFDFIDFDQELKNKEDQNLRSEQIYVNDPYYNKIFRVENKMEII